MCVPSKSIYLVFKSDAKRKSSKNINQIFKSVKLCVSEKATIKFQPFLEIYLYINVCNVIHVLDVITYIIFYIMLYQQQLSFLAC